MTVLPAWDQQKLNRGRLHPSSSSLTLPSPEFSLLRKFWIFSQSGGYPLPLLTDRIEYDQKPCCCTCSDLKIKKPLTFKSVASYFYSLLLNYKRTADIGMPSTQPPQLCERTRAVNGMSALVFTSGKIFWYSWIGQPTGRPAR